MPRLKDAIKYYFEEAPTGLSNMKKDDLIATVVKCWDNACVPVPSTVESPTSECKSNDTSERILIGISLAIELTPLYFLLSIE